MQNPSMVHSRSGPTCRRHICSPTGTSKIRNRARGPPALLRTQGSRRLSPASVIPVGRHLNNASAPERSARSDRHTWIGAVDTGSPVPIDPTPTSASNIVGGYEYFLRGGFASHHVCDS